MNAAEAILDYLNDQDEKLSYIAKEIWDHPQIALEETFAAKLLSDELAEAGFTIEHGVGQMETAFVASWGEGRPIIGILGEYDALPGLSQDLDFNKTPLVDGGPGHGCGHNLFGTACFGAAMAVKERMEAENVPGTIRFYGCPAEETLVGKTFMAKDGVFDDLDAALSWHPGATNMGRSALDGAMLMDVGVNYLREHVVQEARIHSVITSGGQAPNVVPAYAQIWYFVRAPKRSQVEEIYARMLEIAEGAAMMSGTTHDIDFITGCHDMLSNKVISNVLLEKMEEVNDIRFTEQERAFARQLQQSFPDGSIQHAFDRAVKNTTATVDPAEIDDPLWERVLPHLQDPGHSPGSTEVAEASQIAPTGQIRTTCWPLGTPPHSWQTVASSGSSIGFKGMLFASKAIALTAFDLMTRPDLLAAAQAEFEADQGGKRYVSPLPEGTIPS